MNRHLKQALLHVPAVRRRVAARDGLLSERDRLLAERDTLAAERDTIREQRHHLRVERDTLATERDTIREQRDHLQVERDNLMVERDRLLGERDTLATERDTIGEQRHHLQIERDNLVVERDRLLMERAAVVDERDGLGAQRHHLHLERDGLMAKAEVLAQEVERLRLEKSRHQDLMLARISTVHADLGGLKRGVFRLSQGADSSTGEEGLRDLYLNLLEDSLVGFTVKDPSIAPFARGFDADRREIGRDWPSMAFTMIGRARMRNLRDLTERALNDGVSGDLLEAGVWRGGACIYMRGILAAYGITDRQVWVADSFRGLPPPSPGQYPADTGDTHHAVQELAVSLQQVQENFRAFGLLDDQVRFLEGWFKDTLPRAPIERLAVLRLDGDMYESTIQTLDALYRRLSPGGFIIIDDYILEACKQAVEDFRLRHHIDAPLESVDGAAVYWRKHADEAADAAPQASSRSSADMTAQKG